MKNSCPAKSRGMQHQNTIKSVISKPQTSGKKFWQIGREKNHHLLEQFFVQSSIHFEVTLTVQQMQHEDLFWQHMKAS